jgi:hypothetical protein
MELGMIASSRAPAYAMVLNDFLLLDHHHLLNLVVVDVLDVDLLIDFVLLDHHHLLNPLL